MARGAAAVVAERQVPGLRVPLIVVPNGREAVYEWRCTAGTPAVVRQINQVDAQGLIADIWYETSR